MARKDERLNYALISRELKEKGPERVYLLHGVEDYLLESFVAELTRACLPEGTDSFSYHALSGADLQAIADSVGALPFGTDMTLTIVRDFDINHIKDRELKALEDIASTVPGYAVLAFIARGENEPDGRLKAVKALRKYAKDINFTQQEASSLINWLRRRFRALGKDIGPEACEALIYASGSLMNALLPEVEKIAAAVEGGTVSTADVESLAFRIPETQAFDMTDAVSAGDFDRAAELLADLIAMNEEPLKILGAVSFSIRRLYCARLAMDERLGDEYIRRCTGIRYDFVLRKLKDSAARFPLGGLRRAVELCAETDYAMKSSAPGGAELLGELLARLAVECV